MLLSTLLIIINLFLYEIRCTFIEVVRVNTYWTTVACQIWKLGAKTLHIMALRARQLCIGLKIGVVFTSLLSAIGIVSLVWWVWSSWFVGGGNSRVRTRGLIHGEAAVEVRVAVSWSVSCVQPILLWCVEFLTKKWIAVWSAYTGDRQRCEFVCFSSWSTTTLLELGSIVKKAR